MRRNCRGRCLVGARHIAFAGERPIKTLILRLLSILMFEQGRIAEVRQRTTAHEVVVSIDNRVDLPNRQQAIEALFGIGENNWPRRIDPQRAP